MHDTPIIEWQLFALASKSSSCRGGTYSEDNFLTFRNRPWNRQEKGSWLLKRTDKRTGEGSWPWGRNQWRFSTLTQSKKTDQDLFGGIKELYLKQGQKLAPGKVKSLPLGLRGATRKIECPTDELLPSKCEENVCGRSKEQNVDDPSPPVPGNLHRDKLKNYSRWVLIPLFNLCQSRSPGSDQMDSLPSVLFPAVPKISLNP